jgi:hypothetical protein
MKNDFLTRAINQNGGGLLPLRRERFASLVKAVVDVAHREIAIIHAELEEEASRRIKKACDEIFINRGITSFSLLANHLPEVVRAATLQVDSAVRLLLFKLLSESLLASDHKVALQAALLSENTVNSLLQEDSATSQVKESRYFPKFSASKVLKQSFLPMSSHIF